MSETTNEQPKKKTSSKSRAKQKELADDAMTAYEQDKGELGADAAEEAKALKEALAALKKSEQEQEELGRKYALKTEEVEGYLAEVNRRRANLGRSAANKFGVRSTRAKAYRSK
jgi:hypothetical protein